MATGRKDLNQAAAGTSLFLPHFKPGQGAGAVRMKNSRVNPAVSDFKPGQRTVTASEVVSRVNKLTRDFKPRLRGLSLRVHFSSIYFVSSNFKIRNSCIRLGKMNSCKKLSQNFRPPPRKTLNRDALKLSAVGFRKNHRLRPADLTRSSPDSSVIVRSAGKRDTRSCQASASF